jgi:quercetin dioxygenase-like cupin family protein
VSDVVLPCPDLDEAIAFFTERLGFRLEALFPADDPRVARLSGHGVTLQLERAARAPAAAGEWKLGRAGMHYRDLVPDRLGGKLIASRIKIVSGGPVADYVHYHEVDFQLIYCRAGWVRVVYEDQGPPFVLAPGDAVLQPPGIRHRVLECAPETEVVEIAAPAEHVTRVEHELALPTATLAPDREFSGQRFVRHQRSNAVWTAWRISGFEACDLGVGLATGGIVSAFVARPDGAPVRGSWQPDSATALLYTLAGSVTLRARHAAETELDTRAAIVLTPRGSYELSEPSADLELLEVVTRAC